MEVKGKALPAELLATLEGREFGGKGL